jgi:aminocarboxymuconate-semialdehyde decarboxylase
MSHSGSPNFNDGPLVIDIHSHYLPPDLVQGARRRPGIDGIRATSEDGRTILTHRQGFRYPIAPELVSLEARIEAMDRRGIDRAIVSLIPMFLFYWIPADEAIDFCRETNDRLAALAAQSEGRIIALATLPMQSPDAAVTELERAVTELHLPGAQLGPSIEDVPLDHDDNEPVLAMAEKLGVPLVLHPYYVGYAPKLEDYYLTNLIGNPLQTALSASRLIFSGTLDRVPDLRIVLLHGGGYLPYQIGRLDHGYQVRPEASGCQQAPSGYLSRFTFDTVLFSDKALRYLIDLVGVDHIAYGTDFPFDMAAGSLVDQLQGQELDGQAFSKIAGDNCAHLFNL